MKKILIFIMICTVLMSFAACFGGDDPVETEQMLISVKPSATTVAVGDKIDFDVVISGAPNAKSVGIELQYDKDVFELVSGDMEMQGDLSGFSDGTGVVAFSSATNINTTIMSFTLKAKAKASSESVKCRASIKYANDATVKITAKNIANATIEVK